MKSKVYPFTFFITALCVLIFLYYVLNIIVVKTSINKKLRKCAVLQDRSIDTLKDDAKELLDIINDTQKLRNVERG